MPGEPIILRCPLCERPVSKIEQDRSYSKDHQRLTIWYHGGEWCFVVDDLRAWAPATHPAPFSVSEVFR